MQSRYLGGGSLQGGWTEPGATSTWPDQSVPGRRACSAWREDWQRQLGTTSGVSFIISFRKITILSRSFVSQSLDLAVPVFNVHSILELGPALQKLGLEDAFSPQVTWYSYIFSSIPYQADFSGLNGAKDLRLSSFLQINTFSNKRNQVLKRVVHLKKPKMTLKERERRQTWEGRRARVERVMSFLRRRNRQTKTYKLHFERQFM